MTQYGVPYTPQVAGNTALEVPEENKKTPDEMVGLPKKANQVGKTMRPPAPDAGAHWWDEVGHEVLSDVEDDIAWLKDAITGGSRAPFAANVSDDQKLEYYRSKFFTPDGAPNEQGRKEELARVGPKGFADILAMLYEKKAQPFEIFPKDFYANKGGGEELGGQEKQ